MVLDVGDGAQIPYGFFAEVKKRGLGFLRKARGALRFKRASRFVINSDTIWFFFVNINEKLVRLISRGGSTVGTQ